MTASGQPWETGHGYTMRWPKVEAPPVRACCGKRHSLPFAHEGEIICAGCRQGRRPGSFRSIFCADCEAAFKQTIRSGR